MFAPIVNSLIFNPPVEKNWKMFEDYLKENNLNILRTSTSIPYIEINVDADLINDDDCVDDTLTIIITYFHGNEATIVSMFPELEIFTGYFLPLIKAKYSNLYKQITVKYLLYEYPGYFPYVGDSSPYEIPISKINNQIINMWVDDVAIDLSNQINKIESSKIKIFGIGYSLGCGFLLKIANRLPSSFDMILLQAPFTNVSNVGKDISKQTLSMSFLYMFWNKKIYDYFDNVEMIENLQTNKKCKIYVMVGRLDKLCGTDIHFLKFTKLHLEKKIDRLYEYMSYIHDDFTSVLAYQTLAEEIYLFLINQNEKN